MARRSIKSNFLLLLRGSPREAKQRYMAFNDTNSLSPPSPPHPLSIWRPPALVFRLQILSKTQVVHNIWYLIIRRYCLVQKYPMSDITVNTELISSQPHSYRRSMSSEAFLNFSHDHPCMKDISRICCRLLFFLSFLFYPSSVHLDAKAACDAAIPSPGIQIRGGREQSEQMPNYNTAKEEEEGTPEATYRDFGIHKKLFFFAS